MNNIEKLKIIWEAVYDPSNDTAKAIEQYFHPDYVQCINGVSMLRLEYINHVIAQKQSMNLNHIEYKYHLEDQEKLFAMYYPKGSTPDGNNIEAEVICYFQFQGTQIIKCHGQVRLLAGEFADVDMKS